MSITDGRPLGDHALVTICVTPASFYNRYIEIQVAPILVAQLTGNSSLGTASAKPPSDNNDK